MVYTGTGISQAKESGQSQPWDEEEKLSHVFMETPERKTGQDRGREKEVLLRPGGGDRVFLLNAMQSKYYRAQEPIKSSMFRASCLNDRPPCFYDPQAVDPGTDVIMPPPKFTDYTWHVYS
jgi:hypothetical protein